MKCFWEEIEDYPGNHYYVTSCGQGHPFVNGNINDNQYIYCPYCGKLIKEVQNEENNDIGGF